MTALTDQLEYNTEREHLIIPEYGRHLQKMINHAVAQESKEERNRLAKAIISVMGNMQPHLRDVPDFQHKLWDQLFIMSDFKLDAESPFDKPTEEQLNLRPEPLSYPQNFPKYRFYGNNIKTMIDVANTWEAGEMKDALQYTIANHMKKSFLNWNKDTVEDVVIFGHLFELSNGKIDLRDSKEPLSEISSLLKVQRKFTNHKKTSKKNNNQRNRKRH
ncbi:MAG: DUF4290 domain-containing protein [Flavobacteriaceae bacterium]|jgi:hypothetical protein|uniref:DUF4290 domain-containing protein n=1 Tax=Wenyingzhuangia sp. TaxID=1964193 RepID=UPI002A446243|nr:DUF4290 domain-containing protein [Flavobacteriaceae bacterium]MDG1794558.1 DUF4290 domain-containing protein [Flavobacteriaceae bacterium]